MKFCDVAKSITTVLLHKYTCGRKHMRSTAERKLALRGTSCSSHPPHKVRASDDRSGGNDDIFLCSRPLVQMDAHPRSSQCATQHHLIGCELIAQGLGAGRHARMQSGYDSGVPPRQQTVQVSYSFVKIIITLRSDAKKLYLYSRDVLHSSSNTRYLLITVDLFAVPTPQLSEFFHTRLIRIYSRHDERTKIISLSAFIHPDMGKTLLRVRMRRRFLLWFRLLLFRQTEHVYQILCTASLKH